MRECFARVAVIFDRKKAATTKTEGAVEIRVTYQRRQRYFATGVKIKKNEWTGSEVAGRHDADELNRAIGLRLADVRRAINNVQETAGGVDLDEVRNEVDKNDTVRNSFLSYIEKRAEVRTHGATLRRRGRYIQVIKTLREWGKINLFTDVTDDNILAFDDFLKKRGLKGCTIWCNYHKILFSFIKDAVDDGLLSRNPYRWVRIDKDTGFFGALSKHLTPDEFQKICNAPLPAKQLERARDLFIFQTWTCLSFSDLMKFDAKKIATDKDGRRVYSGTRGKTGKEYVFMLLPEAEHILEKYNGRLPRFDNAKYNYQLKLVAAYAGIKKAVSSHWARHTGATLFLNQGVPMEIVAKILGHASTDMTRRVYAKLFDDTVAKEMQKYLAPKA